MLIDCRCLFCIYRVLTCHCKLCVDSFLFYDLPSEACISVEYWIYFLKKNYICCCMFHPCKTVDNTCWCIRCTFYIEYCECKMCIKRKSISDKVYFQPNLYVSCKHTNCSTKKNLIKLYDRNIIKNTLKHHNIFMNELQEININR